MSIPGRKQDKKEAILFMDNLQELVYHRQENDVQIKPAVYASSTYCETSSNQDEISLLCLVKDFQPKSINQNWSSDNRVITTGVNNYPAVLGQNMTYTMSSVLKVSASDWNANKVYHCKAGYKSDEMVTAEVKKPTPQAPHVFSVVPSPEVVYNQTTAALGCMLSGFYPDSVQVSWFKAGVHQSGTKLPSKKEKGNMFETISYLTVQVADWKKGDEYTCEVIHEATGFNTRINMKYQEEVSLFLQNPSMQEVWINKTATLVCTAVCSDPSQVRIIWNVNGKQRSEGVIAQAQKEEGAQYMVISQLRTTAEQWENGMEVVCSAQSGSSSSPVSKRTRSIKVQPKSPKVRLLPPSAQEIKNHSRVTLECVITGFYPDSIQVSWEKDGSLISSNTPAGLTALEQTETFSVRHYLSVSTEEWWKGSVFTCAVSHPPSNFNSRKEVKNVQEISVFIRNPSKEEVWINRTATVLCTAVCSDPSQVRITWNVNGKQRSEGITTQQQKEEGTQYTVISHLQTTAEEWESGVEFVCSAQSGSSSSPTSKRTRSIKVQPKSPKVRLLPPSAQEIKNHSRVTLECVITGFYPDSIQVSWEKDGSLISSNTRAGPTALEQTETFSVRHYLSVSTEEWWKGSVFTCAVSHPPSNFNSRKEVKNVQEMSIFIRNPSIVEVWINKTATVECAVVCSDPSQVQISWEVSGKKRHEVIKTQRLIQEGILPTVISQLQTSVEEWESGVDFVCSAQSAPSSSTVSKRTRSLKAPPKSPKVRLLPPSAQEIKNHSRVTLECVITGFYPDSIQVSWEKDGSLISSNTRAGPTALEQTETFSVRHYLSVSTEEWWKGSVFTCAVSHPPSNFNSRKEVKNVQEMSIFLRNPSIVEIWINKTATVECAVVCSDPSQVQISWEVSGKKRHEGIKTQRLIQEGILPTVISQLQTSVEEWESGVDFVCSAQSAPSSSPMSKQIRGVKVEPKSPKVRLLLVPPQESKNKNTVTFECMITEFYPDLVYVSWEKDSTLISSNTSAGLTALEQAQTFRVRHYLTVSAEEWRKGSAVVCTVFHPPSNSTISATLKNIEDECLDSRISVTISKPPFEEIWRNRTATILCEVLHTDLEGVRVTWKVDGIMRQDGVKTQSPKKNGHKETIFSRLTVPAAEWESGVECMCLVEDRSLPTPEKRSIRKAQVDVKTQPQVFLLPPSLDEMETAHTATLVCLVTGFSPAEIDLVWMANDTLLKTGFMHQPVTEDGRGGWNSGSHLTVSAEEWNSGTTYSCVVGHESVTANVFRSINKSHSKPNLVNVSLVLTDSYNSCS
ncbi:uncharacterized protein [Chiloscyllium punctatum]|uniref:uncharacterized protein isoform X1 n=1 Tax=Chiloscyllium punctatum TaxID=137246 RepID=UPI003B6324F7